MTIETDLTLLASWVKSAHTIVAFTGAGISTPSGIPDFRSPDSGLWHNADPMTVASIFGFRQNPQAFYDWVRPLTETTLRAKPNPAHLALAQLEAMGKLKSIITQNIDMLHTRAGNRNVHELHGHMREATCITCFRVYPAEGIMESFLIDRRVPTCASCGGVLKPNVILFGEQLPYKPLQEAKEDARQCDLMLVIGSSLEVAPASDIPVLAKRTNAKVALINLEETFFDRHADLVLHGDAADIMPRLMQQVALTT